MRRRRSLRELEAVCEAGAERCDGGAVAMNSSTCSSMMIVDSAVKLKRTYTLIVCSVQQLSECSKACDQSVRTVRM